MARMAQKGTIQLNLKKPHFPEKARDIKINQLPSENKRQVVTQKQKTNKTK